MNTEQVNQIDGIVATSVPPSVAQQQLQQHQQLQQQQVVVRMGTGGWMAFTIPISAFEPSKVEAMDTFFSLTALAKSGLGSPSAAMYTFMVAVGHSLESGTGWNGGKPKKQANAKRHCGNDRATSASQAEEEQEQEQEDVPRFPADIAFEILVSKYNAVIGLRIHVIPKAGQVDSEVQEAAFRQRVQAVVMELLESNYLFRGRANYQKGRSYDGDAFRHDFKTMETVLNTYAQFASSRPDPQADIMDVLSLEQELENSRKFGCKVQTEQTNYYKTLDGPVFPIPPLVVRFDSKSITPSQLTRPALLFRMEAVLALHDFQLDLEHPMKDEDVKEIEKIASQERAKACVGQSGLNGRVSNPTQEDKMAEISLIEHVRRERKRRHKFYKDKVANMPERERMLIDVEKELGKIDDKLGAELCDRFLNIDSDPKFHNDAFSAVAKHLREVDIFDIGSLIISDDLTPFGNFLVVMAGCMSELWGVTAGQKQQMVFSTFFGALTAFDVTDRSQNLAMHHLGEAGIGKSFSVEVAGKLIPPGVVQEPGHESTHANTMTSHDRDGTTSLVDEFSKKLLDDIHFPERARFFRLGITKGMMEVRRAICSDDRRGKEDIIITMSMFVVMLANESMPQNEAMRSRVASLELDRRARAGRGEMLRQALSQAAILGPDDKSFMAFRTVFSVAALYLVEQSCGVFPPTPNRVLRDTLLYIDQHMSKYLDMPSGSVRTPLRAKMLANVMAVVKGVVTVLASPLQRTLYADLRNGSMYNVLKAVREHVVTDAQVVIANISMFDRTIMSEEEDIVRRALEEVAGMNEVVNCLPRKYFDDVKVLVETLAGSTGVDRERLKSLIEIFQRKTVTLKIRGETHSVPFVVVEKGKGSHRVGVLNTKILRLCTAIQEIVVEINSETVGPQNAALAHHNNRFGFKVMHLPQDLLVKLLVQNTGRQEASIKSDLDLLLAHRLILKTEDGNYAIPRNILEVKLMVDENVAERKTPVQLALEFMSTAGTSERLLVLLTNVLQNVGDCVIVCPQLETVRLQPTQKISPSYSFNPPSKYRDFLMVMTGTSLENMQERMCDEGYSHDIDLYAMEDAVKTYGIKPRGELFSVKQIELCIEIKKQSPLDSDLHDAYCKSGEYPQKLVDMTVGDILARESKWKSAEEATVSFDIDDLTAAYQHFGLILDDSELNRRLTSPIVRAPALRGIPEPEDTGASSSRQGAE